MKNKKLYDPKAVNAYVSECVQDGTAIDVIEGCLQDTYILYHSDECIEVWQETYLNCWSSAYVRHIYRKGLPTKWVNALQAEYARLDEVC